MTAQRSCSPVWSGRDCQAAGTQASPRLAGTPTERAACRGRAGSPRGQRPGPEVPRPRGAGREAPAGGSRRPAGAPPCPRAPSPRAASERAGGLGPAVSQAPRAGPRASPPLSPPQVGTRPAAAGAAGAAGAVQGPRGSGGRWLGGVPSASRACGAGFPQVARAPSCFPALPAGPLRSLEPRQRGVG